MVVHDIASSTSMLFLETLNQENTKEVFKPMPLDVARQFVFHGRVELREDFLD